MADYAAELKKSIGVKLMLTANALFDLFGLFSFATLSLTTLKHKKLHTSCHLLVGLYSLCYMGTKMILFPTFFLLINPWLDTFPIFLCSLLQSIPLSASYNIFSLMFVISVDRMLSVLFPIWYTMRNDKIYLIFVYSLSSIYPIFVAFVILNSGFSRPNSSSLCTMFEMTGQFSWFIFYLDILLVCLTVISYLAILVKILCFKLSNAGGQNSQQPHPALKSLAIIMTIQIGGWLAGMGSYWLVGLIKNASLAQSFMLYSAANCVVSIASTAEVPSLYLTSSDHRVALRKELNWLFKMFAQSANQNTVSSVLVVTGVNLRRNTLAMRVNPS